MGICHLYPRHFIGIHHLCSSHHPCHHRPGPSFYSLGPSSHTKGDSSDAQSRREPHSSHPRSSPPPAGGSVDAFCEQNKLKDSICSGLKELGFEIGDDLSSVKDSQWERHVGIPPLTVTRILKKYKAFLQGTYIAIFSVVICLFLF